ncbi:MAG: Ig-like domain-containing protein [Pirellulaceae bacterium]
MVLTHVTLSKNMTEGQDSTGGGLFFRGSPVNVRNSIIAENTSATGTADWAEDQFDNPPPVSEVHYSLIGDNSGTGLTASATADANGNLIGTNAAPFDPGLDNLQPNGGPVHPILGMIGPYLWAHAVQVDSPALNAGSDALAKSPGVDQIPGNSDDVALLTDQRGAGFPRNFGGHVDMGAVEYLDNQAPGPIITSTISGPTNAATIPIEIDFGEEVVDFVVGDLTVTNVAAINFASQGNGVFRVNIAPAADGLVKVDIAANVTQDLFGNNNVAATTFSITSDRTAPAAPVITGISDDTGSSSSDGDTSDTSLTISGTAEDGSMVEVFRDATSIGTATATGGSWSLADSATLAAGDYVYTAKATDVAGNVGLVSDNFDVTVDLTSPAPVISSTVTGPTNLATIPVGVTFGENVTGFVISDITVTNGSASNLQSLGNGQFTVDVTPTADGEVQVNIAAGVASDVAGNNNTAATTFSITSDRTPPAAPVITGITDDTGSSNSDGITNDTSLTISGTAEAGSSGWLELDGRLIGGFGQIPGNWSIVSINGLSAGTHIYKAKAVDAAGNESEFSTAFQVTVDLSSPAPVITSTATSPTALSPIPVTIDFGESVVDFVLGDITVTNGSAGNLQSPGNGQFTVDVTPAADGQVQVNIAAGVASDIAGNNNTAATTFSITSDRTAPAAPIITGISDDTGSSSSDGITTDTSLTISGTAEAGSMVEVFRGVTSLGTTTASGGSWSLADSATLAAGDYVYTAKATDVAGNVGTVSDDFDVTVDLTPPAPVISSTVTGPTNLATIPVVVTFGEAVTGFVLSDISITNGTPSNFQSAGNGVFTLDVAPNSDGAVQINIAANVAQDLAGNGHSAAATFTITSDRTAPAAPVITGISGDEGSSDSDGITNSPLWAVLGTAEAGTVVELFLNGNSVGTVSHQGTWLKDQFDSKSDGTFVYTAQATDAVGNVSAMSESFTVVLDRAAPAAPSVTGISDDTGSSGSDGVTNDTSLTISGTAEAGSTVEVFRGATSLGTTTANGGNWSLADSATLAQGTHVYSAKATDVAGNTSAASANFTATIDVTKPTPSITSSESSPSAASPIPVTINFGESVTGFVLADITVTNGVASNLQPTGAGTFTVEVTPSANGVVQVSVPASVATDLAGNTNLASATFEIVSSAIAVSDLSLSLIDLPTTVRAGVGLIYLLEVTNNGPDDATGTEVTVDLPPGVIYEPDFSSSDCTLDGNIVTCAIGDLPADPGSDAANTTRRTVTVHVPSGTAADARLDGLASVSSNNDDATAANNDAAVNTVVTRIRSTS